MPGCVNFVSAIPILIILCLTPLSAVSLLLQEPIQPQSATNTPCTASGGFVAQAQLQRTPNPKVITDKQKQISVHCENATTLDAIRAIAQQTRLPMGIVLGQDLNALDSDHSHSIHIGDKQPEQAIQEAIAGTGYTLKIEEGVLVLVAPDVTIRQQRVRTIRYPDFKTKPQDTIGGLSSSLHCWMIAALYPNIGCGGSILSSSDEERFTLGFPPDSTTEEVANKIVSQGSKGLWILKVEPFDPEDPKPENIHDQIQFESYQFHPNLNPPTAARP